MRVQHRSDVGLIIFPFHKGSLVPMANLVAVVSSLVRKLYIITGAVQGMASEGYFEGENCLVRSVEHRSGTNHPARAVRYVWTQLRICHQMVCVAGRVKTWLFFLGGENLLLPMLIGKLMGGKVILVVGGFSAEMAQVSQDSFAAPLKWIFGVNCHLADRIVLYSRSLVNQHSLRKYEHKISIAHKHFLDFRKFRVCRLLSERGDLVGYVGRLSGEKGVLGFVQAIPDMLKDDKHLVFSIGGDGPLQDKIEDYLDQENLTDKVRVLGWISHDELPDHLNGLKLVVLPSYTEGLPNVMLEAMACGTPVLATPVGGVPDVIRDGETGFLMGNNSPECIARNVTRALNHPALAQIARNARAMVESDFTFEKAVADYRRILHDILL